jgi:hypothetical protein
VGLPRPATGAVPADVGGAPPGGLSLALCVALTCRSWFVWSVVVLWPVFRGHGGGRCGGGPWWSWWWSVVVVVVVVVVGGGGRGGGL